MEGMFKTRRPLKLIMIALTLALFAASLSPRTIKPKVTVSAASIDTTPATRPDAKKARAAFNDAVKVFFSARCINCHPGGDVPLQGDEGRVHDADVVRGAKGMGTDELSCTMCHLEKNTDGDAMPPGAPDWRMPPADNKMVFKGVTPGQLCRQLKDPKGNGGHKTPLDAIHHIESDPRVRWAWTPGNNRTPPPIAFDDFVKKMNTWATNGAACPD